VKHDINSARKRLIVALDVDNRKEAMALVDKTESSVGVYKIGLQLFIKEGQEMVKELVDNGLGVFLDLKLHDIPNTIVAAAKQVARMGVSYFTVHCSNGCRALEACCRALDEFCEQKDLLKPTMLGVTVLTSMSDADLHGTGIISSTKSQVELLTGQAYMAGVRAFVASAREAVNLKKIFPDVFVVTPGIRPGGATKDDQSRVMTPYDAIKAGADALVVGRPITRADDPACAAAEILDEIFQAVKTSD